MLNRVDEIILAKQRINDRVSDMLENAGIPTVTSIKNKFTLATAKLTNHLRAEPQLQSSTQLVIDEFHDSIKRFSHTSSPAKLTPEQERVMTTVNLLRVNGKELIHQHPKPVELAAAMVNLSRFQYLFTQKNLEFLAHTPSPETAAKNLITLTVTYGISQAQARHLVDQNISVKDARKAKEYAEQLKSYLKQQLTRLQPGTKKYNLMHCIQLRLNDDMPASLDELRLHVVTLKNITSQHQHFASIKRFGIFKRAAPTSRVALDKIFDEQNDLRPMQLRG